MPGHLDESAGLEGDDEPAIVPLDDLLVGVELELAEL